MTCHQRLPLHYLSVDKGSHFFYLHVIFDELQYLYKIKLWLQIWLKCSWTMVVLLYISAESRLWRRDAQSEQITVFVTFLGKPLKWWSTLALFMRGIMSACFCRISQHHQEYSSTTEFQRPSLIFLPSENYNLHFMGYKNPYLSSLLVTCHQNSRLYGVCWQ